MFSPPFEPAFAFSAAHQLGRVAGQLQMLPADAALHLGFALARDILTQALESSVSRSPQPIISPSVAAINSVPLAPSAGESGMIALTLGELRSARWGPLSNASAILYNVLVEPSPAPNRASDRSEEREAATEALGAALQQVEVHIGRDVEDPALERLMRFVGAVAVDPLWRRSARELKDLETPAGIKSVEVQATRPLTWAINLHVGRLLHRLELLPYPVPLTGLVQEEWLRAWEADVTEGQAGLFQALSQSAARLQSHIDAARRDAQKLGAASAGLRKTSRAPLAFALVRTLGACRPKQLERALSVSRLGAVGMLESLRDMGLLYRDEAKLWRIADYDSGSTGSARLPVVDRSLTEFDEAMAGLDALLDKLS